MNSTSLNLIEKRKSQLSYILNWSKSIGTHTESRLDSKETDVKSSLYLSSSSSSSQSNRSNDGSSPESSLSFENNDISSSLFDSLNNNNNNNIIYIESLNKELDKNYEKVNTCEYIFS